MAYVTVDSTAGTLNIYDSNNSLLASVGGLPAFDNAMHSLSVCRTATTIIATFAGFCAEANVGPSTDPYVYLGSTGGTVHYDNFSFSKGYSTSEPKDTGCAKCAECPIVCGVCSPSTVPEFWFVDLGAGGLTNNRWGQCASLTGEFGVAPCAPTIFGAAYDPCCWITVYPPYTTVSGCTSYTMAPAISINFAADVDPLYALVTVQIETFSAVGGGNVCTPALCGGAAPSVDQFVTRYSARILKANCNAEITVTKYFEDWCDACGGTLPTTITLRP